MRTRLRGWAEALVEKALQVKIYREPPFGVDPLSQIRHLHAWSARDVVFDVGANDGRTVLRLQQLLPSPRIFAFEPVSSTFQGLERRTQHLDNVRCFPLALGADRGSKTIYLNERAVQNSFSPQWAKTEPVGTEVVEVTTVDQVMEEQGVDLVHLLKIDTEGHEMAVLQGAQGALSAHRVGIILVEAGIDQRVSPHTPLEQLRHHLAPMGYFLHGIFSQSRTSRRTRWPAEWPERADNRRPSLMKYGDAVFIPARFDDGDSPE